jgi:hypothetical protein
VMITCKDLYKIDFVFIYTRNKTNLTLALALMLTGHEHYYCALCHDSAHVQTVHTKYSGITFWKLQSDQNQNPNIG